MGPTSVPPQGISVPKADEILMLTTVDSKLLVFEGDLAGRKVSILVDSGASAQFISDRLAHELALPLTEKKIGDRVKLANGLTLASSQCTHTRYSIGPFSEKETFHLLTLSSFDLVLGRPWLNRHNPDVDWPNNRITITQGSTRYGIVAGFSKLNHQEPHTVHMLNVTEFVRTVKPDDHVMLVKLRPIGLNWDETATAKVKKPIRSTVPPYRGEVNNSVAAKDSPSGKGPPGLNDSGKTATTKVEGGNPSREESSLSRKEAAECSPGFQGRLQKLLKAYEDVVPSDPDFKFPFPPKRTLDFEIKMIPHGKVPNKAVYKMSPIEQEELRKQLDELIERGFIRPSQSAYGSPVLFVKKKNGALRMCVDYRAINALTVKWKYPIPDINMLLDQLKGARYFTKIDLNQAYYQVRVAEDSKQYTAMLTRWGLWEWNCLSFGLSNAPSHFSRLMMDVFKDLVDVTVLIFLDDILIYSKREEDHLEHVRVVLEKLRQHQLYARALKCDWAMRKVDFLGHIVSAEGISVDPSKIASIQEWPVPKTRTEVLAFKGLAGYYRRFVKNFSDIAGPLSALTSDKVPFVWGDVEQQAFDQLKEALTTAPVLMAPDPRAPYVISTDASGFAIGGVLSQVQEGEERVVSYESRRLNKVERNYPTHDRELLAVMEMLKRWRHYIQNGHRTVIFTDNTATKYILTKPTLMGRQKKWAEQLSEYDVEFQHRAGKLNIAADALSRRSDYSQTINSLEWVPIQEELIEEIGIAIRDDKDYQALLADIAAKTRHDYTVIEGLLYKDTRLVIPTKQIQESLLQLAHDGPLGGHLGRDKTLEKLQRCYHWAHMSHDVQEYCRTCPSCQLNKPSQQKPIGLLQPLPIPGRPWESIGIDFITGLPLTSEGYSVLMTVVDRLSKFLVLVPTTTNFTTEMVASLFLSHVVKRFGFPISIVSDRDPRFVSAFWKELTNLAGIKRKMSSAAHPQTDGVTEQANRTVASMARSYIASRPTEWSNRLSVLEIAYNDSVNASTGYSPYFLCSGTNPILPLSLYAAPTFKAASTADKSVQQYVNRMRADIAFARLAMQRAQARQVHNANRSRRRYVFALGDLVLINEDHFKETSGSNLAQADGSTAKLNAKFRGPFKVIEVISEVSYRVGLPSYMKHTHNAFHASRLRPYLISKEFPARAAAMTVPEPQIREDGEHWEVQALVGHRLFGPKGRHLQVLVQFTGVYEKEWLFALDLGQPPEMDADSYLRILEQYAATSPKGSGPAGRPATASEKKQLSSRLQAELERAREAVVVMVPQLGPDTEPTAAPHPTAQISERERRRVARCNESAARFGGGRERTGAPTKRPDQAPRSVASDWALKKIEFLEPQFVNLKNVAATPEESGVRAQATPSHGIAPAALTRRSKRLASRATG